MFLVRSTVYSNKLISLQKKITVAEDAQLTTFFGLSEIRSKISN